MGNWGTVITGTSTSTGQFGVGGTDLDRPRRRLEKRRVRWLRRLVAADDAVVRRRRQQQQRLPVHRREGLGPHPQPERPRPHAGTRHLGGHSRQTPVPILGLQRQLAVGKPRADTAFQRHGSDGRAEREEHRRHLVHVLLRRERLLHFHPHRRHHRPGLDRTDPADLRTGTLVEVLGRLVPAALRRLDHPVSASPTRPTLAVSQWNTAQGRPYQVMQFDGINPCPPLTPRR